MPRYESPYPHGGSSGGPGGDDPAPQQWDGDPAQPQQWDGDPAQRQQWDGEPVRRPWDGEPARRRSDFEPEPRPWHGPAGTDPWRDAGDTHPPGSSQPTGFGQLTGSGQPLGSGQPPVDPVWGPGEAGTAGWAVADPRASRPGVGVRRLIAVLAVTLLVCGSASFTGYLLVKDDFFQDDPTATASEPAAAVASGPAVPPSPTPSGTPLPRSSTDARFVVAGQCVRNEGGNDDPKLTITPCGPRTYEVLERFDGATTGKDDARSKCSAVSGYTDWYFFDSPLDVLDYVLCLKSR